MSVMIASGRQMRLVMNGTATAVARAEASAVRMATANLAAAAICQERSEVAARLAEQAGWMSAGTALVASGALLSGWLVGALVGALVSLALVAGCWAATGYALTEWARSEQARE